MAEEEMVEGNIFDEEEYKFELRCNCRAGEEK